MNLAMLKYFDVEDVQETLPQVERLVRKLMKLNKSISLLNSIEIDTADLSFQQFQNITKMNKTYHKLSFDFYKYLEALERIGCILKDVEQGLVDFYSRFEGRDILLCWKLGEKRIRYWHEISTGFQGRQPIVEIGL